MFHAQTRAAKDSRKEAATRRLGRKLVGLAELLQIAQLEVVVLPLRVRVLAAQPHLRQLRACVFCCFYLPIYWYHSKRIMPHSKDPYHAASSLLPNTRQ